MKRPQIGDAIHGFANGYFGRDSYDCRLVEAVGLDWLVTRDEAGKAEFLTLSEFANIADANDRSYCYEDCEPRFGVVR